MMLGVGDGSECCRRGAARTRVSIIHFPFPFRDDGQGRRGRGYDDHAAEMAP